MLEVTVGNYRVQMQRGSLPAAFDYYRDNALLFEEFDLYTVLMNGNLLFVGINDGKEWPTLVIAQRYEPSAEICFAP